MGKSYSITSESVTEGHPDKLCDQISDGILDALYKEDPQSRVAIECLTTTGTVHVAGEVTTNAYADVQKIVRETLRNIGYTDPGFGIDCDDAGVWVSIHGQSPDISLGVTEETSQSKDQGAGDHKLAMRLAEVRKSGLIKDLGPDGKSQVTVLYEDGKPVKVTDVVIAQQHLETIEESELKEQITEKVIKPVVGELLADDANIHINATGKFVIGGPEGDTGLTGRKIIVDTYGGVGRHGGGAFSGKDPSKVDRSAAYAARWVAKNVVAAGLADKCEVQLSYAIGVAKPTNLNVDCLGTAKVDEEKINEAVRKVFDLRPKAIIESLNLRRPIYQKTAAYGHFGRDDPDFTWEVTDKAEELKKETGL